MGTWHTYITLEKINPMSLKDLQLYNVIDLHISSPRLRTIAEDAYAGSELRNSLNKRRSNNDIIYLKLVNLFQLEDATSSVCVCEREREPLFNLQRFKYKYHATSWT